MLSVRQKPTIKTSQNNTKPVWRRDLECRVTILAAANRPSPPGTADRMDRMARVILLPLHRLPNRVYRSQIGCWHPNTV
jgi:hypothetical protein